MFFRASTLFVAVMAFTISAAAMPGGAPPPKTTSTKTVTVTATTKPTPTAIPASQCNTGNIQCCNSVQSSSDPVLGILLTLLGVVVQGINVPIGLTCDPISVIGVGGNSCSAQTVCCENNTFKGVVAIGCTPINISL